MPAAPLTLYKVWRESGTPPEGTGPPSLVRKDQRQRLQVPGHHRKDLTWGVTSAVIVKVAEQRLFSSGFRPSVKPLVTFSLSLWKVA